MPFSGLRLASVHCLSLAFLHFALWAGFRDFVVVIIQIYRVQSCDIYSCVAGKQYCLDTSQAQMLCSTNFNVCCGLPLVVFGKRNAQIQTSRACQSVLPMGGHCNRMHAFKTTTASKKVVQGQTKEQYNILSSHAPYDTKTCQKIWMTSSQIKPSNDPPTISASIFDVR